MKYFLTFVFSFFFITFAHSQAENIRPFKDVFIPEISQHSADKGFVTEIRIPIPKGYYLYADKLTPIVDNLAQARVEKSPSAEKHDPYFGNVEVYTPEHPAIITIHHQTANDEFEVKAQGCEDGVICYPPDKFILSVAAGGDISNLPTANETQGFLQQKAHVVNKANTHTSAPANAETTNIAPPSNNSITAKLDNNFWLALPFILLLGIGVSFTACVYPLIPIVTSLVVGKNTSSRRAHFLIATYIFGMGIAMAILGAIFGLFQINLQALLQRAWIVVLVALFFALLSLAMFDVYTLQTPRWLQRKTDSLNRQQKSGSFFGAMLMGALSILVVSPCATPVLTALLLYTAQTTPLKGAVALFIFGIGTGLPLLLFASVLRRFMPKAGAWMSIIKRALGFIMFGVSLWLVIRLLPNTVGWYLWAAYALLIAVYFDHSAHHSVEKIRLVLRYLAGTAFLAAIFALLQTQNHLAPETQPSQTTASFTPVNTVDELKQAVAQADKPVIVDFYADWCIACQVWEKEIWHNPRFTEALSRYRLVKIDMTDYNADDKALMQTLNLVGPPAVLFYSAGANLNAPQEKIIGELTPEEFSAYLR